MDMGICKSRRFNGSCEMNGLPMLRAGVDRDILRNACKEVAYGRFAFYFVIYCR